MARGDFDVQLTARGILDDQSRSTNDAIPSISTNEHTEAQAGVRRVEALSRTWTTASLIIAYVA